MITARQQKQIRIGNRGTMRRAGLADILDQTKKYIAVTYDFDLDETEGAVGNIPLGYTFPEACIVTKVLTDEMTPLTSGGSATLTLQSNDGSAADITVDVAFDTGFAAVKSMGLEGSAEGIKIAALETLELKIAGADLTAGKVRFYLEILPQRDM